MIKNATVSQIRRALEFSYNSNFAMATRRIIHNFSEMNIRERGYFNVDVMSGIGSGLIIYQNYRFFLLTARHNLDQLYPEELRNESPIWVPKEHPPKWDDMLDFFMARRVWYVGELIEDQSDYTNLQDLVLIEFFFPMKPLSLPKQFITIENHDYFLKKSEFFDKQILMCSGYPKNSNFYSEVDSDQKYTQSTTFNLERLNGMLILNSYDSYVEFKNPKGKVTHDDLNGYSGGPVYSVYHDNSEIKLAGITLTGGGNKLRFLPAYIFHDALISYRKARCLILDNASYIADETERPDEILKWYCELEHKDETYMQSLGL